MGWLGMAKNVYKKPVIVFYEEDQELYDIMMNEADKNRSSLRAIILNTCEEKFLKGGQGVTQQEEVKIETDRTPDPFGELED